MSHFTIWHHMVKLGFSELASVCFFLCPGFKKLGKDLFLVIQSDLFGMVK